MISRQLLLQCSRKIHSSKFLKSAKIIDGKRIANEVLEEVKVEIDHWVQPGRRKPKLIAILVGDNPASRAYVGRKIKAAKLVGIDSETIRLDDRVTQEYLLDYIQEFNLNSSVDGILVQLPVPKHICEKTVCQAVDPSKDVDGFHLVNIGNLALDAPGIIPATAYGVKELIVRSAIDTRGKTAVVIGRSKHVGFPIALLLHSDGNAKTGGLDMTTTICHRHTPLSELRRQTLLADIVVASAGVPGLVTRDMIKPGACVIDVGITRVNGKLVGDVDFEGVEQVAGHITPVPGGVGPMTVAMLMKNTLIAAQQLNLCNFEISHSHANETINSV